MKAKFFYVVALALPVFFSACGKGSEEANNKPQAKFSISGYEVPVPVTVTFINVSSNGSSYHWNFGDGSTSTDFNPTHTYGVAGTYKIELEVTGPEGVSKACKFLTVEALPSANQSAFSYYQEKCNGTPLGIAFKTLNPASTSVVWDLGYGSLSLDRHPIGQYLLPGDYTVKHSTMINGIRDTVIRIIRVE